MKKNIFSFLLMICLFCISIQTASGKLLNLDTKGFIPITFEDIPATRYEQKDGYIAITVDRSASFLLKAFDSVKEVKKVRLQWRSEGELNIHTAELAKGKKGDDAKIRIGLLLEGEPSFIPFFVPDWLEEVNRHLKAPSNGLVYVVSGVPIPSGEHWPSPYADEISMFSAFNRILEDGWTESIYEFKTPLKIVGLWIMADGDNSESRFQTDLRALELSP